jgi:hypothetical protein
MQAKLVESEGSEGSTEARDYSKQNSHVRSDNNIQDNYKKLHSNTTNSNNIITQWIMKRLTLSGAFTAIIAFTIVRVWSR